MKQRGFLLVVLAALVAGCAEPSDDPREAAAGSARATAEVALAGSVGEGDDGGESAAGYWVEAFAGQRLTVSGEVGPGGRLALLTPALDEIPAAPCDAGACASAEVVQPGTWTVVVRAPARTAYDLRLRAEQPRPNAASPSPPALDPAPVEPYQLEEPLPEPYLTAEWLGYVLDAGHLDAFRDAPVGPSEPGAYTVRVPMEGSETVVAPTPEGMAVEARLVLGGSDDLARETFEAVRALLVASPARPRPGVSWPVTERAFSREAEGTVRARAVFDAATEDEPPSPRVVLLHESREDEHAVVLRVYGPGTLNP